MCRTCLAVGGEKLSYDGETASKYIILPTTKILVNRTIFTPIARFAWVDLAKFYYGTPMHEYEYMKIKYYEIPDEIIQKYNLDKILHTYGYMYLEIIKDIPGMNQSGKINNDQITKHLNKYGYHPWRHMPSLWKHEKRYIKFNLLIDDFGINYQGKENIEYLWNDLEDLYVIPVDLKGATFLVI